MTTMRWTWIVSNVGVFVFVRVFIWSVWLCFYSRLFAAAILYTIKYVGFVVCVLQTVKIYAIQLGNVMCHSTGFTTQRRQNFRWICTLFNRTVLMLHRLFIVAMEQRKKIFGAKMLFDAAGIWKQSRIFYEFNLIISLQLFEKKNSLISQSSNHPQFQHHPMLLYFNCWPHSADFV